MPYRRYSRNRMRFRRRRFASRLPYRTAKAVKAIATRAVKQWTPLKEIRFNALTSQFLTNGTIGQRVSATNLTSIALGDQYNQRTGPKIYITGVKLDFFVANASSTLDRHFNICLATDISRSQTLDIANFTNLMEDSSFVEQAPSSVNTNFQYTYNHELLKVHLAKRCLLSENGSGSEKRQLSYFWKPKRPYKVQFERVSSTELTSGKLWLLLHLAEAGQVASADVVNYQWRARVFFRSV